MDVTIFLTFIWTVCAESRKLNYMPYTRATATTIKRRLLVHVRNKKFYFLIQHKFDDNTNNPPSNEYYFMMFNQLKASGVHIHPGTIGETTGIFDLGLVWKDRILKNHFFFGTVFTPNAKFITKCWHTEKQ